MEGIKPCPYCGGEVEMVKLNHKKGEKKDCFRIECRICHKLVVRGIGFANESLDDSKERIEQYEKFVKERLYPGMTTRFRQSETAKRRDNEARRFFKEV